MLQFSKVLQSREEWKNKAVFRAAENRDLKKSENRNRKKIAELKNRITELTQSLEEAKKNS